MRIKDVRDERVHLRMAIIRELFGLEVEEGVPSAELEDDEPLAEVRELRR
jgi:hypothetical protein